jgi:cystathionine beta-lyase/cystathionine gamma-synthase
VGLSSVPTEPPENTDQTDDAIAQLDSCLLALRTARRGLTGYATLCAEQRLVVDDHVLAGLRDALRQAESRVTGQRQVLGRRAGADTAVRLTEGDVVVRYALTTLAYVRGALEWCSPSYAQSGVAQFFHLGAQDWPNVNYERYEHRPVERVERQLLELFDLRPDEHGISATSSGMAAFSLVESFLVRHRLKAGDTVLLAPYIYFESAQQLAALPHVRTAWADDFGTADLLAAVRRHSPRVVFADPLANTHQQRMIDLAALLAGLRATVTERTTLVVDGTMLSGAIPAELLACDDRVEVLYFESGSKYLQLGMDAGMAGMVAYPADLRPEFELLRRNGGLILYRHGGELFPAYDRDFYQRRMRRIGANAARMATLLHADPAVRASGRVSYPTLDDHPDRALARSLPYAGGCVNFLFHDNARNTRDELNVVFDRMFTAARIRGVHLTKGASFGFATPRVSAADAFAEGEPPFLRLYAGDRADQVDALVRIVARVLADVADTALAS